MKLWLLLAAALVTLPEGSQSSHACIHDDPAVTRLMYHHGHDMTEPASYADHDVAPLSPGRETEGSPLHQRHLNVLSLGSIRIGLSTLDVFNASRYCTHVGQVVMDFTGGTLNCTSPDDILTDAKRQILLNTILPLAVAMHSERLSVARMTSPLTVSFPCPYFTTPSSHRAPGIEGVDMIVYVAASPIGSESTMAWAGPCQIDQNKRVTVGRANFAPRYISNATDDVIDEVVRVGAHELTHALGFSYTFFTNYYPAGASHVVATTVRGKPATAVTFSGPVAQAQLFFNCSSVSSVELEDQGGTGTQLSHWERRNHYQDLMAGISGDSRYSALTLAMLEASGNLFADYTKAEAVRWGHQADCDFLTEKCNANATSSAIRTYFCNDTSTSTQHCTYDRTAIGVCYTGTYSSALPTYFQYYRDAPTFGGLVDLVDACPMVLGYSNRQCDDASSSSANVIAGTYYGDGGRCFSTSDLSRRGYSNSGTKSCLRVRCLLGATLQIKIGDSEQWLSCPFGGGAVEVSSTVTYKGTVACPPSDEVCDDAALFYEPPKDKSHSTTLTPGMHPRLSASDSAQQPLLTRSAASRSISSSHGSEKASASLLTTGLALFDFTITTSRSKEHWLRKSETPLLPSHYVLEITSQATRTNWASRLLTGSTTMLRNSVSGTARGRRRTATPSEVHAPLLSSTTSPLLEASKHTPASVISSVKITPSKSQFVSLQFYVTSTPSQVTHTPLQFATTEDNSIASSSLSKPRTSSPSGADRRSQSLPIVRSASSKRASLSGSLTISREDILLSTETRRLSLSMTRSYSLSLVLSSSLKDRSSAKSAAVFTAATATRTARRAGHSSRSRTSVVFPSSGALNVSAKVTVTVAFGASEVLAAVPVVAASRIEHSSLEAQFALPTGLQWVGVPRRQISGNTSHRLLSGLEGEEHHGVSLLTFSSTSGSLSHPSGFVAIVDLQHVVCFLQMGSSEVVECTIPACPGLYLDTDELVSVEFGSRYVATTADNRRLDELVFPVSIGSEFIVSGSSSKAAKVTGRVLTVLAVTINAFSLLVAGAPPSALQALAIIRESPCVSSRLQDELLWLRFSLSPFGAYDEQHRVIWNVGAPLVTVAVQTVAVRLVFMRYGKQHLSRAFQAVHFPLLSYAVAVIFHAGIAVFAVRLLDRDHMNAASTQRYDLGIGAVGMSYAVATASALVVGVLFLSSKITYYAYSETAVKSSIFNRFFGPRGYWGPTKLRRKLIGVLSQVGGRWGLSFGFLPLLANTALGVGAGLIPTSPTSCAQIMYALGGVFLIECALVLFVRPSRSVAGNTFQLLTFACSGIVAVLQGRRWTPGFNHAAVDNTVSVLWGAGLGAHTLYCVQHVTLMILERTSMTWILYRTNDTPEALANTCEEGRSGSAALQGHNPQDAQHIQTTTTIVGGDNDDPFGAIFAGGAQRSTLTTEDHDDNILEMLSFPSADTSNRISRDPLATTPQCNPILFFTGNPPAAPSQSATAKPRVDNPPIDDDVEL